MHILWLTPGISFYISSYVPLWNFCFLILVLSSLRFDVLTGSSVNAACGPNTSAIPSRRLSPSFSIAHLNYSLAHRPPYTRQRLVHTSAQRRNTIEGKKHRFGLQMRYALISRPGFIFRYVNLPRKRHSCDCVACPCALDYATQCILDYQQINFTYFMFLLPVKAASESATLELLTNSVLHSYLRGTRRRLEITLGRLCNESCRDESRNWIGKRNKCKTIRTYKQV